MIHKTSSFFNKFGTIPSFFIIFSISASFINFLPEFWTFDDSILTFGVLYLLNNNFSGKEYLFKTFSMISTSFFGSCSMKKYSKVLFQMFSELLSTIPICKDSFFWFSKTFTAFSRTFFCFCFKFSSIFLFFSIAKSLLFLIF